MRPAGGERVAGRAGGARGGAARRRWTSSRALSLRRRAPCGQTGACQMRVGCAVLGCALQADGGVPNEGGLC
eukprot:425013-Prymnesium_polylepis.2